MEIVIGADHAGFALKQKLIEYLRTKNIPCEDVGCFSEDSVNYPEISRLVADKLAEKLTQKPAQARGVICCGSGIGVSMAANRFSHVRAVEAHDHNTAIMSRRHNDANVLCLGGRVIASHLAVELLDTWLNTDFEGGRHQQRVDQMSNLTQTSSPDVYREAPQSC